MPRKVRNYRLVNQYFTSFHAKAASRLSNAAKRRWSLPSFSIASGNRTQCRLTAVPTPRVQQSGHTHTLPSRSSCVNGTKYHPVIQTVQSAGSGFASGGYWAGRVKRDRLGMRRGGRERRAESRTHAPPGRFEEDALSGPRATAQEEGQQADGGGPFRGRESDGRGGS
jgi:hypothetical protein